MTGAGVAHTVDVVRVSARGRRDSAHVVTEARRSRTEDIAYRERRYLMMMAFRAVCFIVTIILYAQGAGWFAAIPAVGAIVIPYFAVVFANAGRQSTAPKGFRAYEPRLPVSWSPPSDATKGDGDPARTTPESH
jgi:DUF3099 family protein